MPQLTRFVISCFLLGQAFLAFSTDTVEEIRIQGNKRVADESILFRISTQVGDTIKPSRITQDIKVLWGTGLFQNLGTAIIDGEKGGKVLIFITQELPLVSEVDYRGNKKITKSSITDKIEEEKLTIEEESPLDYRKINAIRAMIKGLLDEKGLRYGTVDYKLEYLDAGNARVVFNISEGSKVRIYDVAFEGNTVFTDKKLARTFKKTREHWMFSWLTSHDVYKDESYTEDVEKVRERYWKKGYKDILLGEPVMDITNHTTEKQKRKNEKRAKKGKEPKEDIRMKLTVPVYEGRNYAMGNMSVDGNTILRSKYYEATFPLQTNGVYDLNAVNEWITHLEDSHNDLGYINFNIEQQVSIRDENVVDVVFNVNENDQVYVHRLKFSGNITTRDKVLRREVLIREGDVFRLGYFRNSILRVSQLGFFDVTRSDPDVSFLPGEAKVDVDIKGQESGVNELNFGLGFSEVRGESGFLSFSTLNFLGRGQKLKFQAQLGSIQDTFDVTFTEPWLFDKPRGMTARIFNNRTNYSAAGFDLESRGFQFGLSFRPTIFTSYGVSYTFSEDSFPTITSPVFKPVDDLLTSSVTQTWSYNTTDHPFFPTRGTKINTQLELASWQIGGDNFFYKIRLGATQYVPAFMKTFFGLNVKTAYLQTLDGQRPTQNHLFYLGGEESVRGYKRRTLGPTIEDSNGNPVVTLGDKMVQANVEYVIPISDQFRFVLFYDAGMIFGVEEDWFDTDLARSTGIEMRFSLPVFNAPLRLMYAIKLDENELNDKGAEPKFSIGTTF